MNSVVHFEIPFNDKEKAKEFYEKVFGWNLEDVPNMDYTMALTGETDPETHMLKEPGRINGGFYKRGEGAAQSSVLVIDVPNVDEHVEKVKAAGGSIFREKTQVGDMGFYAQVKDNQGNIIGLWEQIKKEN